MNIIGIVLCSVALMFSLYKVVNFNNVEKLKVEKPKTREISKVPAKGRDFWYRLGWEGASRGVNATFTDVPPEFVSAYRKGEEDYRRSK
ncbi:MAG: hypothetical protein WC853_09040 [Thermodesulfovibrionales bacterium]